METRAEERLKILLSIGDCQNVDALRAVLSSKEQLLCYDGFEPSGRMHLAHGLLRALHVKKLIAAGCKFVFWIADTYAFMNDKIGSDRDRIRVVGEYMIEMWKALGLTDPSIEYKFHSDATNKNSTLYWLQVIDVARTFNLRNAIECLPALGLPAAPPRGKSDELPDVHASQLIYPCMQCADAYFLGVDVCQLGKDQEAVNRMVLEYAKLKNKQAPVILEHSLLPSLKDVTQKMSTSEPDATIFMDDSEADVNLKIKKAFCAPKLPDNPVMELVKLVIMPACGKLVVKDRQFNNYEEVREAYESEALHPGDLKPAVAAAINGLLQPVRAHFISGAPQKLAARIKPWLKKK